MSFKKLRGVSLPYDRQGQIYFTCRNYDSQPIYTRNKINRLCESVGGEYAPALFELLVKGRTVPETALKFFVSEDTLARCRKQFYLRW